MERILAEKKLYALVGEKIRAVRRALTPLVSQEDVHSRSNKKISRSSVANIERGSQRVSLHQLFRIADILNVEPAALLPARHQVFEGTQELPQDLEMREWVSRVLSTPPQNQTKKDKD